jgi:hypothetical protein
MPNGSYFTGTELFTALPEGATENSQGREPLDVLPEL